MHRMRNWNQIQGWDRRGCHSVLGSGFLVLRSGSRFTVLPSSSLRTRNQEPERRTKNPEPGTSNATPSGGQQHPVQEPLELAGAFGERPVTVACDLADAE